MVCEEDGTSHMNDINIRYAESLLAKATREGECLICHLSKSTHGYCKAADNELAHRVIYQALKGEVPEGLYVLHTCDNRGCINPLHLYAGTPMQNVLDRMKRNGDATTGRPRLLTPEQEAEAVWMRQNSDLSMREIGEVFKVNGHTIRNVLVRAGVI